MHLILAAVIAAFGSKCPPRSGDFEPPTEILVAAANARSFEKAKADFDASKPLIGIDGRHFGSMELDLVGI